MALRDLSRQAWMWKILSFVLFFGAWEIAGQIPISLSFPTFVDTFVAFMRMTFDGSFLGAYAQTVQPLLIGVLISSFAGIACGVGMGLWRGFEWCTLVIFIILQAAPVAAIIPLITYLYGIGLTSKVIAVVIMSLPLIVLNSYKGIRHTHPSLLEMSRSFQGSRMQEIMKIILPAASPLIFAGLRLGVGAGFIGVVLAELLITPTGIGDLITYHRSVADYPEMFAAITSIIVLAAVTLTGLLKLEVFVRPENRAR
ncbi:MAG: ABC transporter permease subunit [Rhodospirillales bacterium]|nr:ABC transporter permease subunit [Rhodospirillales bacterium]